MAKKKKTSSSAPSKKFRLTLTKQQKVLFGTFLVLFGIALAFSFISYFSTWEVDQSSVGVWADRNMESKNWLNKFGANVGHFFIYKGFGIASFSLVILIIITGWYYFMNYAKKPLRTYWLWGMLMMIWLSVVLGFFNADASIFSGTIGYEINDFL